MTRHLLARTVRASLVLAVVAATTTLFGIDGASAAPAGNGVFVACGYGTVAGPTLGGPGCESLPQALTEAVAFGAQYASGATVELMPGDYCPTTLPYDSRSLTLVGIGLAGIDTSGGEPISYTGPEAALTSFTYNSAYCGNSPPTYGLSNTTSGSQFIGAITLENLAVDGTATGPSSGIYSVNAPLSLRDVLVENFSSGTGLSFQNAYDGYAGGEDLTVENSAFVNNQTGVNFYDEGSIDDSTIAGNSGSGVSAVGDLHLDNDTIAHNGTGIYIPGYGNQVQMANSIVGDNSTDCSGTVGYGGDLEYGGALSGNGKNLIGVTCDSGNTSGLTPDITLTDTIGALDNSGLTPHISPPGQAQGAAESGWCGSTDQLESSYPATPACDIGSINTTGVSTPDVTASNSPLDFGSLPINEPGSQSVTVYNSGGGVVGVSGFTLTGDSAFSVDYDGCTFSLLLTGHGASCQIGIQAAPTVVSSTPVTGTLVVHLAGAADVDVALSAVGAPAVIAPSAPINLTATPGNREVDLSWQAPASDGGQAIQSYDLRYSKDGGSTWTDDGSSYSTDITGSVDHLTNGTAYIFEVSASNGFAAGPESMMSASVTPRLSQAPGALTAPKATTIDEGKSASLTTTLTDSNSHAAMAGAVVHLLKRAVGTSGAFTPAGSATTNTHGVGTVSIQPKVNTAYEWSFNGNSAGAPAPDSATATVSVAQVITASLTVPKIAHGKKVSVFGTVSPNESGQSVGLEVLKGGKWVALGITATIRSQALPGHGTKTVGFVLSYSPKRKGAEKLRVSRAKTAINAAGVSNTLALKVT